MSVGVMSVCVVGGGVFVVIGSKGVSGMKPCVGLC